MARKHFTLLGNQIDMSALAVRHAQTVALGNARMNARGDVLGPNGVVLKTQEQIDEEWRRAKERQMAQQASIQSADLKAPMQPSEAVQAGEKKVLSEDQDFDPAEGSEAQTAQPAPRQTRRKIVETD
jgi:hypothetical protein